MGVVDADALESVGDAFWALKNWKNWFPSLVSWVLAVVGEYTCVLELVDGGFGNWFVCVVGGLGLGWDCPKAWPWVVEPGA